MRKSIIPVLIFMFIVFAGMQVYAAVNAGEATIAVRTNTKIFVTITTHPSDVTADSVYVCKIVSGTTDTLYIAQTDTLANNLWVTGQVPGQTSTYFLLARKAGATDVSETSELTMYPPEYEDPPASNVQREITKLWTATSWRPTNEMTYSLTLDGYDVTDSTGVVEIWKTNGVMVVATQAGDSVKAVLYVKQAYRERTQTGSWIGNGAAIDSLNITSPGSFFKTFSAVTAAPDMYMSIGSYTNNGHNASYTIYTIRDRN